MLSETQENYSMKFTMVKKIVGTVMLLAPFAIAICLHVKVHGLLPTVLIASVPIVVLVWLWVALSLILDDAGGR